MKSKKKKNKQNILIAYNKSIASMQGIELAMLFCHAGFSVKTILLDGAEEHISSEILKEITGHASWSNSHKPNWVKAEINYPVGIIIEPTEEILKNLSVTALHSQCSPLRLATQSTSPNQRFGEDLHDSSPAIRGASLAHNNELFTEYIKNHCGFIKILVNKESSLNQQSEDVKKQIIVIPDNLLNLRSLFEKILSETVTLIAAKTIESGICYCFEGDFSKIDYLNDLEKAFAEAGMEKNWIATDCCAVSPLSHRSLREQPPQSLATRSHPVARLHTAILGGNRDSSPASRGASEPRNDDVVAVAPHCIRNAAPSVFCFAKDCSPINGGASSGKEIEIVFEADEAEIEPTKNRIYVSKHKNGLILNDSIETRLLPDLTCQSCFSRLVNYLKVELTRNRL